jgi:hypothetical protein
MILVQSKSILLKNSRGTHQIQMGPTYNFKRNRKMDSTSRKWLTKRRGRNPWALFGIFPPVYENESHKLSRDITFNRVSVSTSSYVRVKLGSG